MLTAGCDVHTKQAEVLAGEDDANLLDALCHNHRREGYEVLTASDGEEALAVARGKGPALMLFDIILVVLGGIEVCRILRKEVSVPILMLIAGVDEIDRVVGLEIGAGDYVSKPFGLRS